MHDILICKICKEPIWNFLCVNCLAENIRRILRGRALKKFINFHIRFLRHFKSETDEFFTCVRCNISDAPPICVDCYMTEIFNRFKNPEIWIINKINEKFRFDFKKHDMIMKKHEVIPITEKENIDKDAGVCDECGEYSNELMLIDGQWVCPDCNEYRI